MMSLVDAVRSRRSVGRLVDPAPSDEEIVALVTDAASAPDHGLLRPWRLIVVRDAARDALGAALAAGCPVDDEVGRRRAAGKPLRAPLLLSIVLARRDNPKVPEWEQLAATSAMVSNLGLLLYDAGYGTIWRTGSVTSAPTVRHLLGLTPDELLLGWLYVGTPGPTSTPAPRPPFAPHERLFALDPGGTVVPLPAVAARTGGRP
ncbi:nitroreductase family protein [Micromonospora sagamiensis]|uniref:Putative NAD(P)H nitroreductase n=1 Tax=Micromonospora sagamiensis TaxID=47875 RepID=A0A562WHS6_9ACTN|nr:nitroreductase [Micromonospora sagamiensis]TWJ29437.1 nitroreductase [Micromonospora sagamiensis]BCL17534.1 nitroreductase [Micromonospora sagamiensis]